MYPLANKESSIVVNLTDDNTASPVTLSLNGGTPLTVKTASGNNVIAGGLVAGMVIAGYIDGTEFRLLSDIASAAIQAAAEAAAATAVAAHDVATGAMSVFLATVFATKAVAEAYTPDAAPDYIRLEGYNQVGVGGALYKKAASEPPHDGKFYITLSDGITVVWYENVESEIDPFSVGVVADGDGDGGGTDNAVTLQAALGLAGARKRPLRILPGVYRCDSGLTVAAGVEIIGYGAKIDFKTGGDVTGLSFEEGGSIRGVKLIGAGNAAMDSAGVAIQCIGTNNTPAAPTFAAGPIIRDCVIDGWAGYGIIFKYTNGGAVEGCKITNIGYAGVMGLSANDMIVDGNLIDGVTPGTGDAYGIAFTRTTGDTETVDPRSYRCKAINNTVRNVASVSGDNAQGLNTHAGVDLVFEGNTVDHCEVGCIVAGAILDGIAKLAPQRCIVRGNVFVSTDTPAGVGTMVSGAIDGTSIEEFAEGCIVVGNTYRGLASQLMACRRQLSSRRRKASLSAATPSAFPGATVSGLATGTWRSISLATISQTRKTAHIPFQRAFTFQTTRTAAISARTRFFMRRPGRLTISPFNQSASKLA